jgi:hypothetical protein
MLDNNGTGSLTAANQSVTFSTQGCSTASVVITGTWSGQLTFQQQSVPNGAWQNDSVTSEPGVGSGQYLSQTTANGIFIASVGGYYAYRILCNIYTSGTINVAWNTSVGTNTASDTTLITDAAGHGPVAVKNASSAAVATDPSLVVALSPNSPLPAGTAAIGTVGVTALPALPTGSNVIGQVEITDGAGHTAPSGDVAARAYFDKITDGTNTAAVKAASAAAAATDPSLVVALSPNSPLPAGTAAIGSVYIAGPTGPTGSIPVNVGTIGGVTAAFGTTGPTGTYSNVLSVIPVAEYNSTAPAPSNGQVTALQSDASGNLQTNLGTLISGEDQTLNLIRTSGGYNYSNYTTANTGVQVKTGAGLLGRVVINTPIASGTVGLYDNTSAATPIALITLPASLVSDGPITVPYECYFATGLYFVSTGTNLNVTLCWK